MAVTLRFQSSGAVPGDGRPIVMRGPSLTIGRGQENDVVLPDPDRMISKTHCVIENHNGSIVVVDFSTNGTFLNYGKIAIGRNATPLNDGDVLILGAYELVVQISGAMQNYGDLPAPLEDQRASFGNADRAPDPYKLIDDAAPGGDFLDSLLGPSRPTGPSQFRKADDPVDLLPPLGDDGPLLGPAPDLPTGPAMRDHSAAVTDSFRPAPVSRSIIPDDWDDLLAPVPKAAQPRAPEPAEAEPDIFASLLAGGPSASAAAMPATVEPPPPAPAFAPPPALAEAAPEPAFEPASEPMALAEAAPAAKPFNPFETDPNRPKSPPPPPAQSAIVAPPPVAAPPAPEAETDLTAASDPARVFLNAVGFDAQARISDAELPATMGQLGRTLKAMIVGLREILMTRTSIKSEFRIEQTMVNVGGNNPLKFSVSPEQAIEAMVKPTARGYLPAEAAAAQALEDIKAHEIAMVTGMEAALKGVLAKLNPEVLTSKIEAKGGFGGFLKNRKAQYWETYEAMYAEISDQAENDFHEVFAREFATAYRAQLARLKDAKTRSEG